MAEAIRKEALEQGETCACGHEHHHEHIHPHEGGSGHENHHPHEEACGCGHEHHHPHEEACGCGHEHHHPHEEACGCGHEHHHPHEEACTCGHEHHHEHGGHCECGHDHGEEQTAAPAHKQGRAKGKQRVYTMQNLGCAHCAAQMQQRIGELEGVNDCVLVYETRQLRVTGADPDRLLPQIREICSTIESGAKVLAPEEGHEEEASPLGELVGGAALFAAGLLVPQIAAKLTLLIAAYLVLGWRVLWTAARNLTRGRVFDENFLMSIATIGAVAIGDYAEAVGVMLFYRIGEFFESRAVERSRRQIMGAVDLRPEVVQLAVGSEVRTIPAADAKEGDIVLVRPGDRVPLDGVVVEGTSRLDTSAVTGEPVPVRVAAGDSALSGCVNTDGLIKMRVTHVLAESMVTRILNSVENAAANKPKLDRFITRFSRVYTPAVVIIALLTALIPGFVTGDWSKWVYTALTFLVISCPCALVLSVPLTYFAGIGAGSKRGILFKGGISLEALQDIKAVVMDKTGTITEGNFVVQRAVPTDGQDAQQLLALAAACETASTHPIAKSILAAAGEKGVSPLSVEAVTEQAGEGVTALFNGQPVLCGNKKLLTRYGIDLSAYRGEKGSTEVLLACAGRFIGHLEIADTVKPDAAGAVSRMKQQGLKTAMLTGDGQDSAEAVAQAVGIDEVRARLLPGDKLDALGEIRAKNGAVLFVGDGINDAPVLAGADVGAAMGSGADAAIEAADVVFMHAALSAVPDAVAIARRTGRIAKQNIAFALLVKALVLVLGLMGIASMWLAVFADSGVALLCVLNSIRLLYRK